MSPEAKGQSLLEGFRSHHIHGPLNAGTHTHLERAAMPIRIAPLSFSHRLFATLASERARPPVLSIRWPFVPPWWPPSSKAEEELSIPPPELEGRGKSSVPGEDQSLSIPFNTVSFGHRCAAATGGRPSTQPHFLVAGPGAVRTSNFKEGLYHHCASQPGCWGRAQGETKKK